MRYLSDAELARSCVVANSRMNRQRGLRGVNSYARDLAFDPVEWLCRRLQASIEASWFDLCCGSGRALLEAATELGRLGVAERVELRGIDLVAMFDAARPGAARLSLESATLTDWRPTRSIDLVTCVHGLHYLGDKLGLISRAVAALAPGGMFVGHLDAANLRNSEGGPLIKQPKAFFEKIGMEYDRRRRLVRCHGRRRLVLPYRYLGADDTAGPNCTGQEAVNSYYEPTTGSATIAAPGRVSAEHMQGGTL